MVTRIWNSVFVKNSMRIVLLLNARFPTEKAYGIQTLTMAEGYAALGHDVAIAYPLRTSEEPKPVSGITFLPFGKKHRLMFGWLFNLLRLFGSLSPISVLEDFRPDVVIANDPFQALILSKHFPVLWELHDLPSPRHWSRRMLVASILRNVLGVISTNALKLAEMKKMGVSLPPTLIAPNAVTWDPEVYRRVNRDAVRVRFELPSHEKSIVYAGQFFDWKGVDTLIGAAAHLSSDHVVHLIGGTGKDLERCQELAKKLPAGSATVLFHGMRPLEEIPNWLRAATLVVIPNSGKFEISVRDTSPLKLFEALAAGAAIVASDLPSIREAVGGSEAVVFFDADDPRSLAETIVRTTEHEERLVRMRLSAESTPFLTASGRAARIVRFFSEIQKNGRP